MEIRISSDLSRILQYARDEAMRTGYLAIDADHLMLGILRHRANDACRVLSSLSLDPDEMKSWIDARIFRSSSIPFSALEDLSVSRVAQNVISMSALEALKAGAGEVLPCHLLLALSRSAGTATAEYLTGRSVTTEKLYAGLDTGIPERTSSAPLSKDSKETASAAARMTSMILISKPSSHKITS